MTTTENSRADAPTDEQIASAWFATSDARNLRPHERAVEVVRKFLAASPVEKPAPSLIDEDAEVPPIMYNGDTKRDPALRELLARQATRHVLTNSRGDSKQPAAPPIDLQGLRRSILTPREIVRDEDGMLSHPAIPYLDEDVNYETFFSAFGIESTFVSMETDVDGDAYDQYVESNDPNCGFWTPSTPAGDSWLLLEIFDTEDGPVALYVREKKPESMRERWKRERRERDAPAPSPADERAAFEAKFPVPGGVEWNGTKYVVDDDYVNSYSAERFGGQWEAWQAARAIAANETGAEGATQASEEFRQIALTELYEFQELTGCSTSDEYRAKLAAMAAEAAPFEITEQAAAEWASRHDVDHVLKHFSTQRNAIEDARTLHLLEAAPHPAQADARVGLTDALIRKIATQYCEYDADGQSYNILRYECEEDFFNCIRALLQGANQ